jgi:hypothetical protein
MPFDDESILYTPARNEATIWDRCQSSDINSAASQVLKTSSGHCTAWLLIELMHTGYSRVHFAPSSRQPDHCRLW